MNKNITLLCFAIAIIIAIRIIFDTNENIVYIVAGINIVAFLFVVYSIIDKIIKNINIKIKESNCPKQIRDRETQTIQFKVYLFSIILPGVAVVIYWKFFCTNLGNDIISVLALGISILDDTIVEKITEYYR